MAELTVGRRVVLDAIRVADCADFAGPLVDTGNRLSMTRGAALVGERGMYLSYTFFVAVETGGLGVVMERVARRAEACLDAHAGRVVADVAREVRLAVRRMQEIADRCGELFGWGAGWAIVAAAAVEPLDVSMVAGVAA
ncbi:MAG: hypothetical protein JSU87_09300 [Gemmatimonadota bacterium]|nr:MAG: hypothetical protein JSU87_09300 [Gemmatimonadota bacterium]